MSSIAPHLADPMVRFMWNAMATLSLNAAAIVKDENDTDLSKKVSPEPQPAPVTVEQITAQVTPAAKSEATPQVGDQSTVQTAALNIPHMEPGQTIAGLVDFSLVARRLENLRRGGASAELESKITGIRSNAPHPNPTNDQQALDNFKHWHDALDRLEREHLVSNGLASAYINPLPPRA